MHKRKNVLLGVLITFGILAGAGVAIASTAVQLLPSGVGSLNQFTTTGSSTHYMNVDESTCNGLTDYNQTSTVGRRDSYAVSLSGIPDGAVITSVAIVPCAGRAVTGGTNPVMNVFYRWNGATSTDAGAYAISLGTPANLATTTYSVSLTKNASSTLEIGAVLTSGTKGIRLSRERVTLTYETLPAAPSSLAAAVGTTTTSAQLTWTDNSSNETSFKIERGTSTFSFVQVASTSANIVSYTDTGLTPGTYYYRVRASNTAGNSSYSNTASTTVGTPADPSSLSVTSSTVGTTSSAVLLWTDNASNETSYRVEVGTTSPAGPFSERTSLAAGSTGYTDFFVTSGATYFYRVRASNAAGFSGYSNVASTTVP